MRVRGAVTDRTKETYRKVCKSTCGPGNVSIWGEVLGDFNDQDPKGENIGFDAKSVAPVLGVDYQTDTNLLFGAAASYSYSKIHWDDSKGTGNINSGYAVLYTNWFNNFFHINGVLLGAFNHYEGKREIDFGSIDRTARTSFNGGEFLAHLGLGFDLTDGCMQFTPFASIDYVYIHQGSFEETGADSLNLAVESTDYDLLREEAGIYMNYCIYRPARKVLVEGKASYIREDRFHGKTYRCHFRGEGGSFRVKGIYPDRNLFSPEVGATLISKDESFFASVRYGAEIGSSYFDQNVRLQMIYKF